MCLFYICIAAEGFCSFEDDGAEADEAESSAESPMSGADNDEPKPAPKPSAMHWYG